MHHLVHGVFHSLPHKGAAFLVLANQKRCAYIFARNHLRAVRCKHNLIPFVRKVLKRHAYKFYRLRMQVEFRRINEQQRATQVMVVMVFLDIGQITHQGHLNGAFAAFAHATNVAFKAVIFVDDFQACALEECL